MQKRATPTAAILLLAASTPVFGACGTPIDRLIDVVVENCSLLQPACEVAEIPATSRRLLPLGTEHALHVAAHSQCSHFDGIVTIGAPLSLRASDSRFSESREIRQAIEFFVDVVNQRGGLRVGGKQLGVQAAFAGDASSPTQVARATAFVSRAGGGVQTGSDFLLGPTGSSLSQYAILQAAADGKIMLAGAAITPSVISASPLAFGLIPSPKFGAIAVAESVLVAAQRCDEPDLTPTDGAHKPPSDPCSSARRAERCAAQGGSCVASLKVGVVFEDSLFPRVSCSIMPAVMSGYGLRVANDASSGSLLWSFPAAPKRSASSQYAAWMTKVMEALRPMQAAGVTVIASCTSNYDVTRGLVEALQRLDYAPLAVYVTAALIDPRYDTAVANGWWQGEYILEPSPWHPTDEAVRNGGLHPLRPPAPPPCTNTLCNRNLRTHPAAARTLCSPSRPCCVHCPACSAPWLPCGHTLRMRERRLCR